MSNDETRLELKVGALLAAAIIGGLVLLALMGELHLGSASQLAVDFAHTGNVVKGAAVIVLGLTFKENCGDLRNSRVIDVIRELQSYGVDVRVHDPVVDANEARHEYDIELHAWEALPRAAAIVAAVSHNEFSGRPLADYLAKLLPGGAFVDVKSRFDAAELAGHGVTVWRL